MKHLKIENEQGQYMVVDNEWKSIDKLDKNDLLKLAYLALEEDYEMDEYDEESLKNPAHQIIYKNIYDKLKQLSNDRDRFKDESVQQYSKEFKKYGNNEKEEL
jgi:hypothetical protein